MVDRKSRLGCAVPPSWQLDIPIAVANQDNRRSAFHHTPSEPINLAAPLIGNDAWPAVNQDTRGTCNAFATVAAEELTHFIHGPKYSSVVSLSEEQFYAAIRAVSFSEIGVELDEETEREYLRNGATFIAQSHIALISSGIAEERLLPYEPHRAINYFVENLPDEVVRNAATRKVASSAIFHNIVEATRGPLIGLDKTWRVDLDDQPTSEIILDALRNGFPVVAGFAILDGVGWGAWFGPAADDYGKVSYPYDSYLPGLNRVGGHSVCIVGYTPNDHDPADNHGWFLFRNSYGATGFSKYWKWDTFAPISPAGGYGHVSARDIDRFCWEYMFRVSY